MRYELSPKAQKDMKDIALYTLRQWGSAQSVCYENDFLAAFDRIGQNPLLPGSRSCEDMLPNARLLMVGKHWVIYRHTKKWPEILRVLHQQMHLPLHRLR